MFIKKSLYFTGARGKCDSTFSVRCKLRGCVHSVCGETNGSYFENTDQNKGKKNSRSHFEQANTCFDLYIHPLK